MQLLVLERCLKSGKSLRSILEFQTPRRGEPCLYFTHVAITTFIVSAIFRVNIVSCFPLDFFLHLLWG